MSFYNNKFTLITQQDIDVKLPSNIKLYNTSLEEAYTEIKRYEVNKHTMYNGHIILNSKEDIKLISKVKEIQNLKENKIYSKEVIHSGIADECFIDSNFIICNSWNLPFIVYEYRTSSNLYSNLRRHRVKMYKI